MASEPGNNENILWNEKTFWVIPMSYKTAMWHNTLQNHTNGLWAIQTILIIIFLISNYKDSILIFHRLSRATCFQRNRMEWTCFEFFTVSLFFSGIWHMFSVFVHIFSAAVQLPLAIKVKHYLTTCRKSWAAFTSDLQLEAYKLHLHSFLKAGGKKSNLFFHSLLHWLITVIYYNTF